VKTIFWGTPQMAVPYLENLARQNEVVAVVTQTDKPYGRGQSVHSSPVKTLAEEKKIPVLQPSVLKDEGFFAELSKFQPEVGMIVAYGRILPREVIQLFPKGIYNIHFSLLPRLRGAAPIQWAILRGEEKTGVTSFRIAESVDSGNVMVQKSVEISSQDSAMTLEEKLVPLGVLVMEETLKQIHAGQTNGVAQSGETTYAPLIKKKDAKIDWHKSAEEIARQIRALIRLGAYCHLPDGRVLKIYRADVAPSPSPKFEPGTLCAIEKNRGFLVACEVGTLSVLKVQLEGKKETDSWSFLQGARLKVGEKFS